MSVSLPATVGKYQILDRLAVGGMAELFKARVIGDHGFEKLVAIKKILPHLALDRTFIEMFFDEARITARLDHRGIVQVFELGTDAGAPYIAMQYVDGLDVLALLCECARTQIRMPPEISAYIAHQVLDALDFAHTARDAAGRSLGIVHRDISPGNVLISRRGEVILTDFGIARAAERRHKTEAGVLKGKYGYMAPEQVLGIEVDGRCDVFSAGTVLVEMVMARRLFTAASDLDILLMVRDARIHRLDQHADDFPAGLHAIVKKALQREPEDRWQSAAAFRDALADWLYQYHRVDSRELAEFIAIVEAAPTVATDEDDEDADALIGPATKRTADRARAQAEAARAEFDSADAVPMRAVTDQPSAPVSFADLAELSGPVELGDLRQMSPIRLIYRLARQRSDGLLVVEGRAGVLKEIYLVGGHPRFVSSNIRSERLGEFLVREGELSAEEMARAVAVMSHFNGKLGDTLVGLGLLKPLDAFRLLARQVSAKVIDVCTWSKGTYRWYPGRPCPATGRSLHLDSFRILGAGAARLDLAFIDDWASVRAPTLVVARPASNAELMAFGLGEALVRVHGLLDGRTTIRDLLGRVRSPDARANFQRLLYLLVETDLARLS